MEQEGRRMDERGEMHEMGREMHVGGSRRDVYFAEYV